MISNESGDKVQTEIQFLRNEVSRLNKSYETCKSESNSLKEELKKLDVSTVLNLSIYSITWSLLLIVTLDQCYLRRVLAL